MDRLDLYRDWLATRTARPAEVMTGLHGSLVAVAIGEGGMEAVPEGVLAGGGYFEDRSIYDSPVFAGSDGEAARTVHLGVDIFAPAGTPVFAPLAGRVHSFADNDRPLDYGPTLILEHDVGDQNTEEFIFYTLYGHLARESLDGLHVGQVFAAGERVGWLGSEQVNGGWRPHLHMQVMLDMMGQSGDFPGVCRRSERDHWKAICPDPGPLLGIDP